MSEEKKDDRLPVKADVARMINTPAPPARYVYSVIGLVFPEELMVMDEVVTIGIIAGSDESNDWRCKLISSQFNGFSGHDMVEDFCRNGEERLRQLHLNSGHESVRFSYPMPVVADGAQCVIDVLWPSLIDPSLEEEVKRLFG